MGQKQRHNETFKKETVKYIQEQTKSVPQIAEELNIPASTLRKWLGQYRTLENEPLASGETLREQAKTISDQEKKIADLEEQIVILKKAMHIFSKTKD